MFKTLLSKIITILTVSCFIVSFILPEPLHALATPLPAPSLSPEQTTLIPSTCGTITEAKYFGGSPVVINIQDLHCHPEVQMNINKMLELLDRTFHLDTVFVEGGYGTVDTSCFCRISDQKVKKDILDGMIEKGTLTGMEYYSVMAKRPELLTGIEDEHLHKANIIRLGTILSKRQTFEHNITTLSSDLDLMKAKYFSTQNRRFENRVAKYKQGKSDSVTYFSMLSHYVEDIRTHPNRYNTFSAINMDHYPMISAYLDVLRESKRLNYRRITLDLKRFLVTIQSRIAYREYAMLLENTHNFSDIDAAALIVSKISKTHGITLPPSLENFFRYTEKSYAINPLQVLSEERRLLGDIRLGLSQNVSELEVSFLVDFFSYYQDYLRNKLSSSDYDYFTDKFDTFRQLWGKYASVNHVSDLAGDFPLLNAYYAVNIDRNNSFIKHMFPTMIASQHACLPPASTSEITTIDDRATIVSALKDGRCKPIVVVTGGFHTEGLKKLLEAQKISYLTIMPMVTKDPRLGDKAYREFAQEQATVLSNALHLAYAATLSQPELFRDETAAADWILYAHKITYSREHFELLAKMMSKATGKTVTLDSYTEREARIKIKEYGIESVFHRYDDITDGAHFFEQTRTVAALSAAVSIRELAYVLDTEQNIAFKDFVFAQYDMLRNFVTFLASPDGVHGKTILSQDQRTDFLTRIEELGKSFFSQSPAQIREILADHDSYENALTALERESTDLLDKLVTVVEGVAPKSPDTMTGTRNTALKKPKRSFSFLVLTSSILAVLPFFLAASTAAGRSRPKKQDTEDMNAQHMQELRTALLNVIQDAQSTGTFPPSFIVRPEYLNPDGSIKKEAFPGMDSHSDSELERRIIARYGSSTYDISAVFSSLFAAFPHDQQVLDAARYYFQQMQNAQKAPRAYYDSSNLNEHPFDYGSPDINRTIGTNGYFFKFYGPRIVTDPLHGTQGTWRQWNAITGENAWLAKFFLNYHDYVNTYFPDNTAARAETVAAVEFARQIGDVAIALQTPLGGYRMGPKGQYSPSGSELYYNTISVENTESMLSVMRHLFAITHDSVYNTSADAAEDFLFNEAIINGTREPLLVQGYTYQNEQWVQGAADAFDTNAWFILATSKGSDDYSNFQKMDATYGESFAFRLMENSLKKFGIYNPDGQLIGISFSPEAVENKIGSLEWGRFGLQALIETAQYEQSQGRTAHANQLIRDSETLYQSLNEQRFPHSPLSPYSTSNNSRHVTSSSWGWNIIPKTFASAASSAWDLLVESGTNPLVRFLQGEAVDVATETRAELPASPAVSRTISGQHFSDNATWKTGAFSIPHGLAVRKGQTLTIQFTVSPGVTHIGYNALRQGDKNYDRSEYSAIVEVNNGKVTFTITPREDTTFVQFDIAVGLGFFGMSLKNNGNNGFVDGSIVATLEPVNTAHNKPTRSLPFLLLTATITTLALILSACSGGHTSTASTPPPPVIGTQQATQQGQPSAQQIGAYNKELGIPQESTAQMQALRTAFLKIINDAKANNAYPPSFVVLPQYVKDGSIQVSAFPGMDAKNSSTAQQQRIIAEYGSSIYDVSTLFCSLFFAFPHDQQVLDAARYYFEKISSSPRAYYNSNNLQSNPFDYGSPEINAAIGVNGYFFKYDGPTNVADPLYGTTSTWEQWNAVTGENAWLAKFFLYYHDYVTAYFPGNSGAMSEASTALSFAQQIGDVAIYLQTPLGGYRMGPKGQYSPYGPEYYFNSISIEEPVA
ncbi:MAG: hypothetical protein ABSH12_03990 [Endomicrobiales bacterium]